MTSSLARAALAAFLLFAIARPAHADDKAQAGKHFGVGVTLYNEGKYSEALIEFQRAYDLAPHPSVLYNLAATNRELSHYDEAIQLFQRFLSEGQGQAKAELLTKAQKELAELEARVARVTVKSSPEGATVSVDGRELGETPLARDVVLGPGRHTFELRSPEGRTETRVVTLASGDAATVDVTFAAEPGNDVEDPGGGGGGDGGDTVIVLPAAPRPPHVGLGVSAASNALLVGDTGTGVVSANLRMGRLGFGADVYLIAWAVVPSLRVRLFGGPASEVYGIAAVPIAITDGDESKVFVAGAGGLGARRFLGRALAVRGEVLASVASGGHGFTLPISLGVEIWF